MLNYGPQYAFFLSKEVQENILEFYKVGMLKKLNKNHKNFLNSIELFGSTLNFVHVVVIKAIFLAWADADSFLQYFYTT